MSEIDRLRKTEIAASEHIAALIDAMDSVLDDMGHTGQSVCMHTKAKARIAFEPFIEPECVEFVMSLDEAKQIVKECDDAN